MFVCVLCVCAAVSRLSCTSVCRPEQNGDVCCSPLHSIHFHPQFVFGLMIVCRLTVGGVFISILCFLCRHERFEKAFLLAVDLQARDLFMVSGNQI